MKFHIEKQQPKRPLRQQPNEDNNKVTDYWTGLLVDIHQVFDAKKQEMGRVVCQTTLPQIHAAICERLFKRALGGNRDRMRHLLFKAWPLRCWSRKFWTVLTRIFGEEPAIERFANRLVLCSLLGNYPHTGPEEPRPQLADRKRLYQLLDARGHKHEYRSAASVAWRKELVERCPRVYMHAIQEFMCADIQESPGLLPHVQNMMRFDAFFGLVRQINRTIRDALCSQSIDYDSLSNQLEKTRLKILKVSYDQPPLPFLEYLREMRSFAKPSAATWFERLDSKMGLELAVYQVQGYVKPSTEISRRITSLTTTTAKDEEEEEEDQDEEKEAKLSRFEKNPTSKAVLIEQAVQEGFERASKRDAAAVASTPGLEALAITSMQITMDHSRTLEQFIGTFDPRCTTSDDVFWTVSRLLPLFGCTELAVNEVQHLWLEYNHVKKAKDRWKQRMLLFSLRHPYAYALIQASRRFFARHQQFQTYPLPSNIARLQAEALRKRWKCEPFEEATSLYVCPCCRNSATLVRSSKTPQLNGITGLRGVITDIHTGKVYCGRSVVFGHRQCGSEDQELVRIEAFGQWVGYKQRGMVLCCHCGHPTRMEPEHAIYDEKGLACINCTAEIRKRQQLDWYKTHPELCAPEKSNCFLCNKALASAKKRRVFTYLAKDTYACYRHKKGFTKLVDAFEASIKEYSEEKGDIPNLQEQMFTNDAARDQARKLLLACRRELKEQQEKNNRARNNYQLKLQKAKDARNQRR